MHCWITLMLISSLFNFYSLFKTHSYVLYFIFIYKNVVNICMIILSTHDPPAHNRNAIFFITRPVDHPHRPVDITAIRASLIHMHHTNLGIVAPGSHKLCLQFLCSPCGLRMHCRSSTDSFWFHTGCACSLLITAVYNKHNIYPLFWFQIQTWLLKILFQHCDLLLSKYSKSIFYRRV